MQSTALPEITNFAQLIDKLGGVAPERVRICPAPGTATVQDVIEIEERENRLCELVDGVLVEKVIGYAESQIAVRLIAVLESYADAHDLGVVTGEGGMFRFPGNLVRIPDVAFARWEQFPEHELPSDAVPEIIPDLAVEVLGKGNTQAEMARKLREYFKVGSTLVWFVDPPARSVTVYSSPTRFKVLSADQSLEGGKVLPGFQLPIATLFKNIGRKKRK